MRTHIFRSFVKSYLLSNLEFDFDYVKISKPVFHLLTDFVKYNIFKYIRRQLNMKSIDSILDIE